MNFTRGADSHFRNDETGSGVYLKSTGCVHTVGCRNRMTFQAPNPFSISVFTLQGRHSFTHYLPVIEEHDYYNKMFITSIDDSHFVTDIILFCIILQEGEY